MKKLGSLQIHFRQWLEHGDNIPRIVAVAKVIGWSVLVSIAAVLHAFSPALAYCVVGAFFWRGWIFCAAEYRILRDGPEAVHAAANAAQPGSSGQTIRFLSFNHFLRAPGLSNPHSKGELKSERLKYFVDNFIGKFDVVMLQEMYSHNSTRLRQLVQGAARQGLHFYVSGPGVKLLSSKVVDGALAIVSRYPIVDCDRIQFGAGIYSDSAQAKGCIYAKVLIAEHKYIHCFTLHLQASYSLEACEESMATRRHQLLETIAFLRDKCQQSDAPIVLAGDFNIAGVEAEKDYEYTALMELLDTYKDGCRFEDPLKDSTKDGSHPVTTIPYIWDKDGNEIAVSSYLDTTEGQSSTYLKDIPKERQLEKRAQRLDYCFVCSNGSQRVKVVDAQVQKFHVDPSSNHGFALLSDHFGVVTELQFR